MGKTKTKTYKVMKPDFVGNFCCDSSKCIKNCCTKYAKIRIDDYMVELYRRHAPELLDGIIEKDGGYCLKIENLACVFFDKEDSLCTIHKKYGASFLPEICCFYPQKYKTIGDKIYVEPTFPCGEMIRAAIFSDASYKWEKVSVSRVPAKFRDVKKDPDNLGNSFVDVHEAVMDYVNKIAEEHNSEEMLLKLLILSQNLDEVNRFDWPVMVNRLIRIAEKKELKDIYEKASQVDTTELLDNYFLCVLGLTKIVRKEGLTEVVASIVNFVENNNKEQIREFWKERIINSEVEKVLKNYIKAKVSSMAFPVLIWEDCLDDLLFIIINYIGIRYALMANFENLNEENFQDEIIKIINSFESSFYLVQKLHEYKKLRDLKLNEFDNISALLVN